MKQNSILTKNVLYHISPPKNRTSILEHGLVPMAGERSMRFGQMEKRIYLMYDLWKVDALIKNSFWHSHPDFYWGFDIWKIIAENVNLYRDEKWEHGLYVRVPLPRVELAQTLKNEGKYRYHPKIDSLY